MNQHTTDIPPPEQRRPADTPSSHLPPQPPENYKDPEETSLHTPRLRQTEASRSEPASTSFQTAEELKRPNRPRKSETGSHSGNSLCNSGRCYTPSNKENSPRNVTLQVTRKIVHAMLDHLAIKHVVAAEYC